MLSAGVRPQLLHNRPFKIGLCSPLRVTWIKFTVMIHLLKYDPRYLLSIIHRPSPPALTGPLTAAKAPSNAFFTKNTGRNFPPIAANGTGNDWIIGANKVVR